MTKIALLCALGMVVIIVAVDFLIFRQHFWPRLLANVGLVLLFAAFYLRFAKHI